MRLNQYGSRIFSKIFTDVINGKNSYDEISVDNVRMRLDGIE